MNERKQRMFTLFFLEKNVHLQCMYSTYCMCQNYKLFYENKQASPHVNQILWNKIGKFDIGRMTHKNGIILFSEKFQFVRWQKQSQNHRTNANKYIDQRIQTMVERQHVIVPVATSPLQSWEMSWNPSRRWVTLVIQMRQNGQWQRDNTSSFPL